MDADVRVRHAGQGRPLARLVRVVRLDVAVDWEGASEELVEDKTIYSAGSQAGNAG